MNEYCEMDGFCYPMPTLGHGCAVDEDCDYGEVCVEGICDYA